MMKCACGKELQVWLAIAFIMLLVSTVSAADYRYAIGFRGDVSSLTGGDSYKFPLQPAYGVGLAYAISERWDLDLSLFWYDLYDDSLASSSFSLSNNEADATRRFQATRLGVSFNRYLLPLGGWFNLTVGAGGGLSIWKLVDPISETLLKTTGSGQEIIDFASTEVFLSGQSALEVAFSSRWTLTLGVHADYFTGAGREFAEEVSSARNRWLTGTTLVFSYSFGPSGFKRGWPLEKEWATVPVGYHKEQVIARDSDGDGVPDSEDHCSDTQQGIVVDRFGCPIDSDRDGIPDGADDCPDTDPRAQGKVDIFGCPVDSDFDGIPDFLDACPENPVGAIVNDDGCPLDSDVDGVPDGLDDCPGTLYGIDVDVHGCIYLEMFSKPMVINIDYVPGSFEIDPRNHERLKDLARVLNLVPEIKLEINGYTDNIGQTKANQLLSEKRANRVRDYLLALDIAIDRIKVFGRGEIDFIDSNATAKGRANNRRIEIIFYK